MNIIQSSIQLKDLQFYAYHGVAPQETKVGNLFIINLTLYTPLEKAAKSDSVDDTISYAVLFDLIKEEMDIPSKLLENVGYRIAKRIIEEFPQTDQLIISVAKKNPPMGSDIDTASIELIVNNKKS